MAKYNLYRSGMDEYTLTVDKQNMYLKGTILDATKTQRKSDKTPEYHFKGHEGSFRLVKTYKYEDSTFTTPYVIVVEGGAATVEAGVPEDFAHEIVRKIEEEFEVNQE
jgi:hypothetical protein